VLGVRKNNGNFLETKGERVQSRESSEEEKNLRERERCSAAHA
jgi:hypothetical protein